MSKLIVRFVKPGLSTTIQDHGRPGLQHLGIPIGGPLDRQSAFLGNKIVGNDTVSPVLEVTLLGPEIEFSADCSIAITGANLSPTINGASCKMYRLLSITAGDILKFGQPITGCRSYLAIAGDWQVDKWMGSASTTTHQPDLFTPKSLIRKNTEITIIASEKRVKQPGTTSVAPKFLNNVVVRVMPGPEYNLFSETFIKAFLNTKHKLSNDCNRMAYRLMDNIPGFKPDQELISSGIVPGTIQITNEGQPIILLADAQTTGGYYRIANIIDEDLDILGQLKPGDKISFQLL